MVTRPPGGRRRVLILAFDDMTLFDVAGPADVFDLATRHALRDDGYDVMIASVRGGLVKASNGFELATSCLHEISFPLDTLVVPGGGPPRAPPIPLDVVDWLRRSTESIRRICGVCTGTFLLAASGLTEGLRVTTHWEAAETLRDAFPTTIVETDPLFVRDGRIWTSAGFSAGADLALALIEEDCGSKLAMEVAHILVVFLVRRSACPQISVPLSLQSMDEDFSKLHAWISEDLTGDLTIEKLAAFAGMAPRTFARAYTARCGRTPGKAVEQFRLEAACRLIVSTSLSLKRVARDTGFSTEANLRRSLQRHYGLTPSEFRTSYGAGSSADP